MTVEEVSQLENLLKKLEPGFLPLPVFLQVCRLTVTPVVEVVPLRINKKGKVEVLLLQREADDRYWPGQWHTPGTVMRSTDKSGSYEDAFRRIFKYEMLGTKVGKPVFVNYEFAKYKRGKTIQAIYWVEVLEDHPKIGIFSDIDHLPVNIVEGQSEMVKQVAAHFIQSKLSS